MIDAVSRDFEGVMTVLVPAIYCAARGMAGTVDARRKATHDDVMLRLSYGIGRHE